MEAAIDSTQHSKRDGSAQICGAHYLGDDGCYFKVWAPEKQRVILHLLEPDDRRELTQKNGDGYFTGEFKGVRPGRHYYLNVDDGNDVPDPASHYQATSVHGPSVVIDHAKFEWTDSSWKGLPFKDLILYEIHVGTFTREGTFGSAIAHLDDLVELGINAIEIMPVSQFPGDRNWGYDGVLPYAVQNSYGGPDGLKMFVDACHRKGIAVFLDVVYNHLGPEGNYLSSFGPYFTDKYATPWGDAINFDGDWSDGVREYFINNALYWLDYYHLDGLRLDAIHMVFDNGALPFWQLLSQRVRELQERLGRPLHLIAESDLNSPKTVNSPSIGGYGFTAQWLDDFHHSLYVMLDEKGRDRYIDFGAMEQLAKAYTDGFVHSGEYVKFRKRKHGASSAGISGDKFVAFNLNHDQVGNRPLGERLCVLVDFERLKLAAAALLLAPYVPMLFMGEEYADEAPFFYFVSHSDKKLIEAVREGRKEEFKDFHAEGESPDPQDEQTFVKSKLRWQGRQEGTHGLLLNWHKQLISLRKELPALKSFNKNDIRVYIVGQAGLIIHRKSEEGKDQLLCFINFTSKAIGCVVPHCSESWQKILDSKARKWMESGKGGIEMPSRLEPNAQVEIPALAAVLFRMT
jgi:maltooligosyltrehalose trehalohydrolase